MFVPVQFVAPVPAVNPLVSAPIVPLNVAPLIVAPVMVPPAQDPFVSESTVPPIEPSVA